MFTHYLINNLFLLFLLSQLLFLLGVTFYLLLRFASSIISDRYGAPYVPLPKDVVQTVVQSVKLPQGAHVAEFGSGDGRVAFALVEKWCVSVTGYEISWYPLWLSRWNRRRKKKAIRPHISFLRQDMFTADLRNLQAVYLYQHPRLMNQLVEKFEKELPPNAWVISARFPLPHWEPIQVNQQAQFSVYVYQKNVKKA